MIRKHRLKARYRGGGFLQPVRQPAGLTLQSIRPPLESSRHYYYRLRNRNICQWLSLSLDTIRRDLGSAITISLYTVNPAIQCSKWVATVSPALTLDQQETIGEAQLYVQ